ncbi:MAG: hypothetical protein ACOVOR_03830 [Rhabdochlamydiaceae bacterium]
MSCFFSWIGRVFIGFFFISNSCLQFVDLPNLEITLASSLIEGKIIASSFSFLDGLLDLISQDIHLTALVLIGAQFLGGMLILSNMLSLVGVVAIIMVFVPYTVLLFLLEHQLPEWDYKTILNLLKNVGLIGGLFLVIGKNTKRLSMTKKEHAPSRKDKNSDV